MAVVARAALAGWTGSQENRRRFVEIVGAFLKRWGYDGTDGRVYGLLLLMDRPVTIAELSRELGLSRSAVSTSLKRLSRDYLVRYQKKGRVKYFSAVPAFLEKFLQQPREILEREVLPLEEIVREMMAESKDPVRKVNLEEILRDLEALDCVLRRIIRLESKTECVEIEDKTQGV
ncbi:ArsR family transcriptional regulator [Thermococcus sp.]|uniref:GbsR/MarR family transcriptional regulator n=1 Tax=Thermococcus sp. TaxID=35749 RepID=UPI00263523CB|nr:ArsR family transcriptional regulator [Thermococcus sp.]